MYKIIANIILGLSTVLLISSVQAQSIGGAPPVGKSVSLTVTVPATGTGAAGTPAGTTAAPSQQWITLVNICGAAQNTASPQLVITDTGNGGFQTITINVQDRFYVALIPPPGSNAQDRRYTNIYDPATVPNPLNLNTQSTTDFPLTDAPICPAGAAGGPK